MSDEKSTGYITVQSTDHELLLLNNQFSVPSYIAHDCTSFVAARASEIVCFSQVRIRDTGR